MAHTASTEWDFEPSEKAQLLALAKTSIEYGIKHGCAPSIHTADYSPRLRQPAASFVTLHRADALRGCIGQLQATEPLVNDVARHAYAAAFQDPRFTPLQQWELADLEIHISVLGKPEKMQVSSEQELMTMLKPGIDGLILRKGQHQATFLPDVWQSLPEPKKFLRQLKLKAGLNGDDWSADMQVSRYRTFSIP